MISRIGPPLDSYRVLLEIAENLIVDKRENYTYDMRREHSACQRDASKRNIIIKELSFLLFL